MIDTTSDAEIERTSGRLGLPLPRGDSAGTVPCASGCLRKLTPCRACSACFRLIATLQIRDLPDPLHQLLQLRARRYHRSLSQQALVDLQKACGGDPRERRRQALAELAALAEERGGASFEPSPEALIRKDRER
jgi:plasmid stability protein